MPTSLVPANRRKDPIIKLLPRTWYHLLVTLSLCRLDLAPLRQVPRSSSGTTRPLEYNAKVWHPPPPQCTSLTQQTAFAFLHRYVDRQIRLPRFAVVRYTFLHHPTPSLPSQKRQKSKCQHRHNHPALSRRQPAIKRVRDIHTRYCNHPRLTMPPSPAAALPPRQYSQYTPPPASRHPSRPRHPLPPPAARPRPRPRPPQRCPRRP